MRDADGNGSLAGFCDPPLEPGERRIAGMEGWILGLV